MNEQINIAKQRIEEGAKFNGVVYAKNNGKTWCLLHIYLDGEFFKLGSIEQKNKASVISSIEAKLQPTEQKSSNNNNWLVNGKQITNNLNYAQMFEQYGTDFE
jgi:hypothetical protein